MKIIENKILPFWEFSAIMLFGLIFTRNMAVVTPSIIRHEAIHLRQMIEVDALCALTFSLLALFGVVSTWWILVSIVAYYILYISCWIVELALPPYRQAYRNICLETEVLYNVNDEDYLKKRCPFSFIKYVSNRKYPSKK